jgi:hypothetical protein
MAAPVQEIMDGSLYAYSGMAALYLINEQYVILKTEVCLTVYEMSVTV